MPVTKTRNLKSADATPTEPPAETNVNPPGPAPEYTAHLLRCAQVGPALFNLDIELTGPSAQRLREAMAEANQRPRAALDALGDQFKANDASGVLETLVGRLADAQAAADVNDHELAALSVRVGEVVASGGDPAEAEALLRELRQRDAELRQRVRLLAERRGQVAGELLASRKNEALEFAQVNVARAGRRTQEAEANLAQAVAQAVVEMEVAREEERSAGHTLAAVRDGQMSWLSLP